MECLSMDVVIPADWTDRDGADGLIHVWAGQTLAPVPAVEYP